jgi:uncharacterized repeat protein (TIGR01451 family)
MSRILARIHDDGDRVIAEGRFDIAWVGPVLKVTATGPAKAEMMETVTISVDISNSGSVSVKRIGVDLSSESFRSVSSVPSVDEVVPGETRTIEIKAIALKPGMGTCTISAVSHEGIHAVDEVATEIIEPAIRTVVSGPGSAHLGSQVMYTLSVHNDGDREMENLDLRAILPIQGMRIASALDAEVDSDLGTATWSAITLPPRGSASFSVAANPLNDGVWKVAGEAIYGEMSISDDVITAVTSPRLSISLPLSTMAAKVGKEYPVELTLTNLGSGTADDTRLISVLPDEIEQSSGKESIEIGRLGPQESKKTELSVMPLAAGKYELVFRAKCSQGLSAEAGLTLLAVATTEIKVTMSDSADPVVVGNDFFYKIVVSNTGSNEAKSVELIDRIPPQVQYVEAKCDAGQARMEDGVLTVDLGDMGTGKETTVLLTVRAKQKGNVLNKVEVKFVGDGVTTSAEEFTTLVALEGK